VRKREKTKERERKKEFGSVVKRSVAENSRAAAEET
jgi:hypothetical protein